MQHQPVPELTVTGGGYTPCRADSTLLLVHMVIPSVTGVYAVSLVCKTVTYMAGLGHSLNVCANLP